MNKKFYFDMDALMSWVNKTNGDEKNVTTTTTFTYAPAETDDELDLVQKEISENKSNSNEMGVSLRYDLAKSLLTVLLANDYSAFDTELNYGQQMAFDALQMNNIIKLIDN